MPSQDRQTDSLSRREVPAGTASFQLPDGATVDHGGGDSSVLDHSRSPVSASVVPAVPGYEIIETLGRGGMGVVYKARHLQLGRVVALKMIRAGSDAHEADLLRFRIEAETIARMQHPNIVQVFEVGEHDGMPFLSLEFCEGGSLSRRLKQAPPTPREAAELVETLARAMHAAHQRLVIHRDLKPANVLLSVVSGPSSVVREDQQTLSPLTTDYGLRTIPKISDFGLAKKLDEQAGQTQAGAVMGTPSYMAPEQARGQIHDLGPAVDIYALGAILYECLTGQAPFKADTTMATLLQVMHEAPVSPRLLRPRIPRDLETICLKCLRKEPEGRYASADALAQDLALFLAGEPILARPTGALERVVKWVRRRPVNAALIAAVVLVSAVGLAAGVAIRVQAVEQRNATHAAGIVQRLLEVDTPLVPGVLVEMSEYRNWANPHLRQEFEKAGHDLNSRFLREIGSAQVRAEASRRKLHCSLALLSVDDSQADYLYEHFLDARPQEVLVIRDALASHKDELVVKLWSVVERPAKGKESQVLRSACALAAYDPDNSRWDKISAPVVDQLIADPVNLGLWMEGLRPVRMKLLPALAGIFKGRQEERTAERTLATNILADYAADQPQLLADLLMDADEKQFAVLYPKFKEHDDRSVAGLLAEIDKQAAVVEDKRIFESKGTIAEDDGKVKVSQGGALPCKRFEVPLQGGKTYRLTMDSPDLDSFLVLQDKTGKELACDDDGGGNQNSLLVYTPSSDDTYTVVAASFKGTGSFVLKIMETMAGDGGKENLAKRQANAAVALLRMNQPAKVWPLLKHSSDPRVRSYLMHRFGPLGARAEVVVKRLELEPDVTIRRALILSLGPEEFREEKWTPQEKKRLVHRLKEMYVTAADPGLHAAAEWLLRAWKQEAWLKQVNVEWAKGKKQREKRLDGIKQLLAKDKEKTPPQWYVNGQGQTMVVVPGPVTFMMGSPPTEAGRQDYEIQHKMRIGRTFALAAKSVTVEQYRQFDKGYRLPAVYARTADLPVVGINWYMAAAYCNWLSKEEGILEDQWCYELKGQVPKLKAKYLSLTGYRLPTEAEMEYATRAGALTSRYYGETDELLPKYAWCQKNSQDKTWPVGSLKPNDLGLFDVQGNVATWCQESYKSYPTASEAEVSDDQEDGLVLTSAVGRVLRGGSFDHLPSTVRSAGRNFNVPTYQYSNNGFRPARTLPLGSN